MKITFIDPPDFLKKKNVERVFGCTYSLYPFPNIFSLSNAAILENEGHYVRYIDMANEKWSINEFRSFFKNDRSDIYAFHSVNLSIKSDLGAYKEIRNIRPDVFFIFSGPAPTYFPKEFLMDDKTFVVRGETELTILELVQSLERQEDLGQIKGLSFKNDSSFFDNSPRPLIDNLDFLLYPARHLLKKGLYYNPKLPKRPFTAVQTSRNCSYRCLFCVPSSASFACELEYRKYNLNRKPPIRLRSADNVIAELKLISSQGYRSVSIIDDQFLWQRERTIEICKGIKNLGIAWGCLARADHLTEEVITHMVACGCRYIDIGIESFNQEILNYIRKDLDIETIYNAIKLLKKYGILTKINLILGSSPFQTIKDIEADIKKAKQMDVDAIMFSIATPFPGTEFYQLTKENRWFASEDYYPESVQMKAIISYPKLSNKELNRLIRKANFYFYLDPKFLKKNFKNVFRLNHFYRSLLALKRKFF